MKIAIIRDDGIGDLIVSSPIIININRYLPSSTIHVYCSHRNLEYCKLLKENKIISNYFLIPNKLNLIQKISLFIKIRKHRYENVFVLSPKNINYLYSKFSGAVTSGVILINSSKRGNNRYRPPKFLINYLLNFNEIIDCRDNFSKSKDIHYSNHYISILKKTFLTIELPTTSYVKPEIKSSIPTTLNENNIFDYIIFHLDEKWNRTNWKTEELNKLLELIDQNTNKNIIITEGMIKTTFNNSIDIFNFKKLSSDSIIYKSTKIRKLFLIKDINQNDLFSLISKSKLVIQKHGGLVHMASSFNVPVIDIIYPGTQNFLKKWQPKSDKYIQITNNNYFDTSNLIINFLKDY